MRGKVNQQRGRGLATTTLALILAATGTGAASAASNRQAAWPDYQVIMWQHHGPEQDRALKRLGVTAGAVTGLGGDKPSPEGDAAIRTLREAGLGWYAENVATDFYAPYHRWSPGRPVDWAFRQAKARHQHNPDDLGAFVREPSLSDPGWRARIAARLTDLMNATRANPPLYVSLGDETGIADLAAFWDFDLSHASVAGFRAWLKGRYGSLGALNREWDTDLASWDQVEPMTTDAAMKRPGENFAPWADFKDWMDASFADALKAGTDAVHEADPASRVAIEGGQIPGWGGYDYARLVRSVDLMELYDGGQNIEIARSLNPNLILLTTSFAGGSNEIHGIWRAWLRGSRGLILWDEKDGFVRADLSPGERGRQMAPLFAELEGGLGRLMIESRPVPDPVAILYSPASFHTLWMLDHRPAGPAWAERDAGAEWEDTAERRARGGYLKALRQLGLEPSFVSPENLSAGGYRVLILPQSVALSSAEAATIRAFVRRGGTLIADTDPGQFDDHGKRLERPALADLFHSAPPGPANAPSPQPSPRGGEEASKPPRPNGERARPGLDPGEGPAKREGERAGAAIIAPDDPRFAEILEQAGVRARFPVRRADGNPAPEVETRIYRHGATTLVAFERATPGETPEGLTLSLPRAAYLYDVRARRALGHRDHADVTLDPLAPTILAISATRSPDLGAYLLLHRNK